MDMDNEFEIETNKSPSDSVSCLPSTSGINHEIVDEDLTQLDNGLAINKLLEGNYLKFETLLINQLRECKLKIKGVQMPDVGDNDGFRYIACGKPYFKDKENIPAPCNEDTLIMKKLQMYDFASISSVAGWTVKDKSDFIAVVLNMSKTLKVTELNSTISQIRRQAKLQNIVNDAAIDHEIENIKKQIELVSKQNLKELALSIDEEYDWDTISNTLNQRHSPQEYRALWKLFLHPSINKSKWTPAEHEKLHEIACSKNCQDWDAVARELNTQRTGYQCFVYFRTNMNNDYVGQKWTKDEEEYLKRVIDHFREGDYIPWGKVAACMENRTKISIYNKYKRLEEQRKGRFLPEEDAVILTCAEDYGTNFRHMRKHLPGRSSIQIRNRYQVLMKNRISTVWTIEEDKKLVQLMANQDDITNYSSVSKYFPGKDRIHLRARYLTLVKWIKRYPSIDISFAPRRGARRLGHGHADTDLSKAIKNLTDKIDSQSGHKKKNIITATSSVQDIEDAIIARLATEAAMDISKTSKGNKKRPENTENSESSLTESNKINLQKILILLRSKLDENLFKNSSDYKKYEGLENSKKAVAMVQVRNYSRKKIPLQIEYPDIYGKTRLLCLDYVLPPNFATMTACRLLMTYVNDSKYNTKEIVRLFQKKNVVLKEHLDILIERFNSLFLWPLLLSNRNPSDLSTDTIVTIQHAMKTGGFTPVHTQPLYDQSSGSQSVAVLKTTMKEE